LLDRYNLCAMDQSKGGWLHFVACTYRNQDETSNIHDNRTNFMNTINYCSSITNIQESALTKCATGHQGYTLLSASNAREMKVSWATPHAAEGMNGENKLQSRLAYNLSLYLFLGKHQ
jgi:hypothetical protein